MQLEDWLDDLCVRFIINLPPEELVSVERICFQVEEAQWFYEDFIRPLDPSLPSLSLKAFSLRIFQHCPLFSTWSMQHYTSAFAEFLAYKQRVPVRGAIMLNEEMDEVVLVKGWKKGANWSFPRGKINKDENDLDCAVREVYEETGYDVQAAGLVKAERDMKYIEVTMREQHMRLYVFRGVPKGTVFEPKTRKEISKVEWYKLTDLPTLKKKHAHTDVQDENPALNANKFYMVAPFLHPLKKWIAQQKKRENRHSSSHLAAPPLTIDESATEGEPGPITYGDYHTNILSPQIPSNLPEVAAIQSQHTIQDPSSHLKELLKIGITSQNPSPPVHIPNADTVKSNALLSLLRNGSTAEPRSEFTVPFNQTSTHQQHAIMSQHPRATLGPSLEILQPPLVSHRQAELPNQQRSLLDLFTGQNVPTQAPPQNIPPSDENVQSATRPSQQSLAPYQRTGDPQFARNSPEETRDQVVPPATALPMLTHHTRALLDAFKGSSSTAPQPDKSKQSPLQPSLAPNQQILFNAFTKPKSKSIEKVEEIANVVYNQTKAQGISDAKAVPTSQPVSGDASTLLNLFKNTTAIQPKVAEKLRPPVELAAGPMMSPKPQLITTQPDLHQPIYRKDALKRAPQALRAGETAATIDGPLNQPHFESILKSPSQISADNMRRSPVPAHRTLFDPKQPTPTKILQRGEDSRRNITKSPRATKANMVVSPKQKPKSKSEKTFQPQILKRPQPSETHETIAQSPTITIATNELPKQASPIPPPPITTSPLPSSSAAASPTLSSDMTRRPSQHTEIQKQNLLALLTGQGGPSAISTTPRQISTSGMVSPLTQSQVVSPLTEEPPISTRSRMGSLTSITNAGLTGDNRPKPEKRQTAAGDKAFLLGYLGRIASQESHTQ